MKKIAGIVMAGGKSTRMGQAKAFLPYKEKNLIEHILSRLEPYCGELFVSANDRASYTYLNLPIISDNYKDCGPLAGIEAVLKKCQDKLCFVVPCDLPLFSGAIIPLLQAEIANADACVPLLNGYPEPLVAMYASSAHSAIQQALEQGVYKVRNVFQNLNVKYLAEEKIKARRLNNIFFNVNNMDEYQSLLRGN